MAVPIDATRAEVASAVDQTSLLATLRDQVSATFNTRRFPNRKFDDEWVAKEGVPGKPAPMGNEKYQLWTAKVCQALKIPLPGKACPPVT